MYMQKKKRGFRNWAVALDVLHIALGFLIVVMGVITFLNPEEYRFFFPVIFFLASVINLADGIYGRSQASKGKKGRKAGWISLAVGILLVVVTVISGMSIWR